MMIDNSDIEYAADEGARDGRNMRVLGMIEPDDAQYVHIIAAMLDRAIWALRFDHGGDPCGLMHPEPMARAYRAAVRAQLSLETVP